MLFLAGHQSRCPLRRRLDDECRRRPNHLHTVGAAYDPGMPSWYHWDRERDRALRRFYWLWIKSPFAGFRQRWETLGFWGALLVVALSEVARQLRWDLPFVNERLIFWVALAVFAAVAVFRVVTAPANLYFGALSLGSPKEAPSPDRPLDSEQKRAIIRSTHAGLTKLDDEFRAAGWTHEDIKPFAIQLIAMGGEIETLRDRSDLAKAFEDGGFGVKVDVCPAGAPEFEEFIGAITVIAEAPDSRVRPIVIDALRSAGIGIRVAPHPPHYNPRRHVYERFATTIVVGQRG